MMSYDVQSPRPLLTMSASDHLGADLYLAPSRRRTYDPNTRIMTEVLVLPIFASLLEP